MYMYIYIYIILLYYIYVRVWTVWVACKAYIHKKAFQFTPWR